MDELTNSVLFLIDMIPSQAPDATGAQENSMDDGGEGASRHVHFDIPSDDETQPQTPDPEPESSPFPPRPWTPSPIVRIDAGDVLDMFPSTPDHRHAARRRHSRRDPASPRPVGGIFEGPEFAYLQEAIALHDGDRSNADRNGGFPFDADDDAAPSTSFGGRGHGQDDAADNDNGAEDVGATSEEKDDEDNNDAGQDTGSDDTRLPPVTAMIQPVQHATATSSGTSTRYSTSVISEFVARGEAFNINDHNSAAPPIPPRSAARPQSYVQQRYGFSGQPQDQYTRQAASLIVDQMDQHIQLRRISAPAVQGSPMSGRQPLPSSALGRVPGSVSRARASLASSSARTSLTITPATAPRGAAAQPVMVPAIATGERTGLTPSSSSGSNSRLTESPSIDSWLEDLVAAPMGTATTAAAAAASSRSASGFTTMGATRVRADDPVTNRDGTVVHDFTFRMPAALPTVADGLSSLAVPRPAATTGMSRVPSASASRSPVADASYRFTGTPGTNSGASANSLRVNENAEAGPSTNRPASTQGDVRTRVRQYENKTQTQAEGSSDKTKENEEKQKENKDKRESKPIEKPEGNWI